jgi:hypothetical protein
LLDLELVGERVFRFWIGLSVGLWAGLVGVWVIGFWIGLLLGLLGGPVGFWMGQEDGLVGLRVGLVVSWQLTPSRVAR